MKPIAIQKMAKKSAGWRFQTFFIFQNIWDNPSPWLSYFSRCLKPPISKFWYWSNFQFSRWHCWWKLQLPRWRWSILAWLWSTTMACGSRPAREDNKGARWGSSWTSRILEMLSGSNIHLEHFSTHNSETSVQRLFCFSSKVGKSIYIKHARRFVARPTT